MKDFNLDNIPSQKGRIAIVTGANIGLGYETALALAQKEMKVILACRTLSKATKAKSDIIKKVPHADLEIIQVDLSSMQSVKDFVATYLKKHQQLDILINNAGIMTPPFSLTEDGFESQMAANYFGHFLLTGLLINTLNSTRNSRVVTLSSVAHKTGKINFDDLQSQKKYSAWKAYTQSKLACLMFAYQLDRKLKEQKSSTISLAAHPGVSTTNITQGFPKIITQIFHIIGPLFSQKPKYAARPIIVAALKEGLSGGEYFGPDGLKELKGKPTKVNSSSLSKNKEISEKLWEISEKLTNITY